MILDYSEYDKQYGAYGLNSFESKNRDLFYNKRGWCPFCQKEIPSVFNSSGLDIKRLKDVSFEESEKVWECDTCGWWEYSFYSYMEDQQLYQQFKDWEIKINSAILKKFELTSKEVPINILRKYISKNNDKIYNINDKKMEELVASVFKDHYNCDVRLVGKSHDGGIDLILIESEKSTIVQVKRRTVAEKVESVKEIRDLLGATLLAESRNCIFVTTANHFSKDSIKAKQLAISKEIVDTFELYDFNGFMKLMDLYKKDEDKAWKKLIQSKSYND